MMVQLRASLEALVMQAWRDRWTELEWSVNLKAALAEDTSEINKLCGLLLKQATLSEVPNKLMFNYLSYTVAAQAVSHSSLLEAVVTYKDFSRELCIEAILDLLNFVRDRLKCNSSDAFQCQRLCSLLNQTVNWLLQAVEQNLLRQNGDLLTELVATLLAFMHNPFVTLCLYFDQLETPGEFQSLSQKIATILMTFTQTAWVPESLKNDFRSFGQKLNSIPQLFFGPTRPIDPREINPSGAHPAVITLASVFGSLRILESPQSIGDALVATFETFRLPWWLILRDFLRGSFLLQLDPGPNFPESGITAYIYLKVPRVLQCLVQGSRISSADVVRAVENVATFHPLLNSLDMKTRSNCFFHFLEELGKLQLMTSHEIATLKEMRNGERISFLEPSSNSQSGIQLVLKGDITLHTLMKSFKSEMVTKHEKLVQMLSHMITGGGKSFEYICAAASAKTLLNEFASRLVEFNRSAQIANGDTSAVRSKMFDLSLLLLSRISYWFGFKPLLDKNSNVDGRSSAFLDRWCEEFGNPNLHEAAKARPYFPDSSRPPDPKTMIDNLKAGVPFWDKETCDWGDVCCSVPFVGKALVEALKKKEVNESQLQKIFETLQGDVCGLVLCFAQWLWTQDAADERKMLALSLQNFLESPMDHDHRNFMATTVRKVLAPMLEVKTIPTPSYPWLICCGKHQLPQLGAVDIPEPDHLRQGFIYALRQGWACSGVLSLVERCAKLRQHDKWTKVWVEESMKLVSVDEMSMACEMFLGVSVLSPGVSLLTLCSLIVDFVLENGHELYCVAPRGTVLARFMVHAFTLAFQFIPEQSASTSSAELRVVEEGWNMCDSTDLPGVMKQDEPRTKIRRLETAELNESVWDPEVSLKSLYRRFSELCEDGEVRPAVYFVASFLRVLSEYTSSAAKKMISLLPLPLLHQVIRTDPKIISAPTVLALHNLEERSSRLRALQNLCLLRQLRAL